MTSELRQAAERLRKFEAEGFAAAYAGIDHADCIGIPKEWMSQYHDDMLAVAKAYLAEHDDDDETPVDAEWLRGVFGFSDPKWPIFHSAKNVNGDFLTIGLVCQDRFVIFGDVGVWVELPAVHTRGDVRRLSRALGVELKEKNNGRE